MRQNLNSFLDQDVSEFGPYNEEEQAIWESDNYLGAIMRFAIKPKLLGGFFTGSQDGTVICSHTRHTNWRFTTIESPRDWNHPVSGTREFGLEQNPDGSYNFYTRGVDRVAELFDDVMEEAPGSQTAFEGADALWTSLQDNLTEYINNPLTGGGMAIKGDTSVNRINYEKVRQVLDGTKSISELGCN